MLSEKTVLVTGGTGAIGAAICREVARHGARVAFTYHRQEEKAKELMAELQAQDCQVLASATVATDSEQILAFVAQIEEQLSGVDILINNLGKTQVMPFALIDEEDWDDLVQVNIKSMFLFTKAVLRSMIRRRSGVILNMGSIAGQRLLEVPVHYATTKAAVTGFTTSLAKEVCRYGIRVNSIVPGLIEDGIGGNVSGRQLDDYNKFCSLGRPGSAGEVANVVAFLASDKASYINAQSIIVDGGL